MTVNLQRLLDEAQPGELEMLVKRLDAPALPPAMLSRIRENVSRRTGAMPRPGHRRAVWLRVGTAAACLALAVSAALWLFLPDTGTREQVVRCVSVDVGNGYIASYQEVRGLSRYDRMTLESRIGDPYRDGGTPRLYKMKGHDDAASLIGVSDDGVRLLTFYRMERYPDAPCLTLGYMLETVYGVSSAGDIARVRFEKDTGDRSAVAKKVKIHPVTVTDPAALERLYGILSPMTVTDTDTVPGFIEWVDARSEAYLTGAAPLSVQTFRRVTLEFENGTSLVLRFDPRCGALLFGTETRFEGMPPEGLNFLTGLADVDMSYTDWGTLPDANETGNGGGEDCAETAVPVSQ